MLAILACGPIHAYAPHLFWARALEITVLLYCVPLLLASGMPVTVIGGNLPTHLRRRGERFLRSAPAKAVTHPAVASGLLLVTPWVLLFTSWNTTALAHPALDVLTRGWLLAVGVGYYYSRTQADPVPRRYPQSLSLLITLVESLADGVLGIVVWLGPTMDTIYYAGLGLTDTAQLRLSQTVGAGMLWLLADVFGLPFLMLLMTALRREDSRRQARADAAIDAASEERPGDEPTTGLWWETDPRMTDRYR